MSRADVVVVGSGPNGLAAAVTMARAGLSVRVLEGQPSPGGGVRTLPLRTDRTGDAGLVMDVCATSPAAAPASAFFRGFDLAARGVEMIVPEASYAQPLDGGRAAIAWRDLDRTAAGLGPDGDRWRRLFAPLAADPEMLSDLALGDRRSVPGLTRPGALLRTGAAFGAAVALLARTAGDRYWRGDLAGPLSTGVMAHTVTPLPSAAAAGAAAFLGALAHTRTGWPLVRGGIGAISGAMIDDLRAHGGRIEIDRPITGRADLPEARSYVFDTHARVLGAMLSGSAGRRLRRVRLGGGVSKLDYVLRGPVPWANPEVASAGTVHIGGSVAQMRRAEAEIAAGRHAEQPVMLVSDPASHDPGRVGAGGLRPLWVYAHVPTGSTRDVRAEVDAQLERFAPGITDLVVDCVSTPAAQMSAHNVAYPGGDISGGAVDLLHMVARPDARPDPYRVADRIWLCSQSAPPGPGIHGMSGWHAARRVLRRDFGIRAAVDLRPSAQG